MAKKATKKATKTTRKMTRQANASTYEQFVEAWNSSENRAEVVAKTGLTLLKVGAWSYNLRKHGVPLKKFKRTQSIDVKKLTEIAKKAMN